MSQVTLKVGDLFEIPLRDGRRAYGQYLHWGKLGYLIRVFDAISTEEMRVELLKTASQLFPPVYVGLRPAIRCGRWRLLGNIPVQGFVHPVFRSTNGLEPGTYHDWHIWDGDTEVFVGELQPEHLELEFECSWGTDLLEQRIMTGEDWHRRLL